MKPRERRERGEQDLFRSRLDQIINMDQELVRLAKTMAWRFIEERCDAVYADGPGMPPLPTRLMAGLAILKHTFDLSDEELCARWIENPHIRLEQSRTFSHGSAFLGSIRMGTPTAAKAAEPHIRSAWMPDTKIPHSGERSSKAGGTNLFRRPAEAAPRVLTVTRPSWSGAKFQSFCPRLLCLELSVGGNEACFDIAPQCDGEFTSHGDDGDAPDAALQTVGSLLEPASKFASRLIA